MLARWPEPGAAVSEQQALHLHGSRFIGLRSRFYDDYLLRASADGVGQIVLVGAGLDTRAYRLVWPPAVRLFEADQPEVLAFKQTVLAERAARPSCERTPVGLDLRDDWPAGLLASGFDPGVATAWLAEGLVAYLPAEAEERLLQHLNTLSAPDSQLALDRIVGSLADGGARLRELSQRSGIDMQQLINTEPGIDIPRLARRPQLERHRANNRNARRALPARPLQPIRPAHETELATGQAAEPPWLNTVFLTARR